MLEDHQAEGVRAHVDHRHAFHRHTGSSRSDGCRDPGGMLLFGESMGFGGVGVIARLLLAARL